MNDNDFLKKFSKNFFKNKHKKTNTLPVILKSNFITADVLLRKSNNTEGCLLSLVMFLLLLKSSCVKANSTDLWICKSTARLPKYYKKQRPWIFICFSPNYKVKVNKSIYIAKLRQRYYKTLKNILLHLSNHALKDMYMLN